MAGIEENQQAWKGLATYDKPFLTLFGEDDPVTGGLAPFLIDNIQGANSQPHDMLSACGHFCQEDRPQELAQGLIDTARKAGFLN